MEESARDEGPVPLMLYQNEAYGNDAITSSTSPITVKTEPEFLDYEGSGLCSEEFCDNIPDCSPNTDVTLHSASIGVQTSPGNTLSCHEIKTEINDEPVHDHLLGEASEGLYDKYNNAPYINSIKQETEDSCLESSSSSVETRSGQKRTDVNSEAQESNVVTAMTLSCHKIKSEIDDEPAHEHLLLGEARDNGNHFNTIKQETQDICPESSPSPAKKSRRGQKRTKASKEILHKLQRQLRSKQKREPDQQIYIDNAEIKQEIEYENTTSSNKKKTKGNVDSCDGLKVFECPECDEVFSHRSRWIKHEHAHRKERDSCPICNKDFRNQTNVKQHMKSAHFGWQEKFECYVCKKLFTKRGELARHQKEKKHHVNVKQKPLHSCPLCNKAYALKGSLYAHLLDKHKNEPPCYECEMCNKKFRTGGLLKAHMGAKHSGIQIECPDCQKIIFTKRALKRHMKVHDRQDSPYECPRCPKKSMTREDLDKHMLAHTDPFNNRCPVCELTFSLVRNYEAHLKKHGEAQEIEKDTKMLPVFQRREEIERQDIQKYTLVRDNREMKVKYL